ncbi:MAG: polysaccharide biosynthesis/export family protein [Phycisphaerales bacterium JB063]
MKRNHTSNTRRIPFTVVAALIALLAGTGCQHRQYADLEAFTISQPREHNGLSAYHMGPPDTVQIQSYRVREIDGHRETISPDGRIHLPLLGPIEVAGRTVDEVRAELVEKAQFYYEDADVNVQIVRYASKRYFVFGQVASPGAYFFDGSNTVLNTLAQARPTHLADPSRVLVLRPNGDGEMVARMTIDLDQMVKHGDTSLNAVLEDGDILFVPPNSMAQVGLAFQQLLLPLQPILETVQRPADISQAATGQRPYGTE